MRKFLLVLWVLVSFGPRVASAAEAPASSRTRPNVIFILADDLGYGDLGCFGQKLIKTPNIDRLAAEGMRFTQAYAGATVCAPSRCTLMTGKHNGHCLDPRQQGDQARGPGADAGRHVHRRPPDEAGGLRHRPDRQVGPRRARARRARRTRWGSTTSSATTASARRTSITPIPLAQRREGRCSTARRIRTT